MTGSKLSLRISLEWLMKCRESYARYLNELPLSTHLATVRPRLEASLLSIRSWFGHKTFNGNSETRSEEMRTSSNAEFTLTGCIDCGVVKAMPKDEPKEKDACYLYGADAVRIWKDADSKHHIIIVRSRPERVFLSCQPSSRLLTELGIAAILNFVERITPEQEEVASV